MPRSRSSPARSAAFLTIAAVLVPGAAVAAEPVRGTVAFDTAPPRGGLARLPSILPNAAVAPVVASRINTALRRLDASGAAAAAECRADATEIGRRGAGAWRRTVEVTMAGPHYFALTVTDSSYCGGPYPNDGLQSAFVYDLATGRPVNWLTLAPAGAASTLSNALDGTPIGLITWRELSRRAAARADGPCRSEFVERDVGFAVSLDGRSGELVARPADLPHAAQACAEEVRLTVPTLLRLGFDRRLVDALRAARDMQRAGSDQSRPSKIAGSGA